MRFRGKRDRLLENLSLGSRLCPECRVGSLYLAERKPILVSCQHCNGEWGLKEDNFSLQRINFANITPLYLEENVP
jgi:uncharacterized protein (DUF983 family)|tara:strand:+ start:285 stop:512 length:228 start_codon:yes stop_codon:yes gene_type:complete